MTKISPLRQHAANWNGCTRCPLHRVRKNVVICRGQVPAEVLFCGEAPGESEDVLSQPFVGPAGKLLDKIIKRAEEQANIVATKCWTNLVGCIPKYDTPERKKVEPLPSEITACYPRLDEFIDICGPVLIVAVGQLAEKWGEKQNWKSRAKVVSIEHPASILRRSIESRGLALQRVEVTLAEAFSNLIPF